MTATTASLELVAAVEPDIERLMAEHHERRKHWYAHEIVPWEQGRSFADEPWDESQATVSPVVRTALAVNLLTEDNLPYYHAKFESCFPEESPVARWARQWTAEEGQHAIAIRSYLLTSRNADPRVLEDDRLTTVSRGWSNSFTDPLDIFVYTSAQELATRISHRNAGVLADDEAAHRVMSRVASDENHHFMFYRGVVSAMLRQAPSLVLQAVHRVFDGFEMPGTTIPRFQRKAVEMARAGVYNLRIHADSVVKPLLRDWRIASLDHLDSAAQRAQEELMAMPDQLLTAAEAFEARLAKRANRRAAIA